MYNSTKFWIFASVCFALATVVYAITVGIFSFSSILNAILFVICIINLILNSKDKNNKNKKTKNKK